MVPAVLMLLLVQHRSPRAFEGPLQVKNEFPFFLRINHPYLKQTTTESVFALSLSHSSVFVMEDSAHWVQTSPFPHTVISEIDNTVVILMLSGRYCLG